ncbi:MAG: hypothetical protein HQL55_19290, partial [Magnetococcales bacterium]|nr:hypothetical protein [Magnetococcales bacterium]
MEQPTSNRDERLYHWLRITEGQPPEWVASYVQSPQATWSVVLEDGPDIDRHHYTAFLEDPQDLPFWAFALAKAYLDDVDEWPLYAITAELALDAFEEHGDPVLAVHHVLSSVTPVWPDVRVVYA